MTPKQKAKQLHRKYFDLIPSYSGYDQHNYICKRAARICAEEIQKVDSINPKSGTDANIYWNKVRIEIELL